MKNVRDKLVSSCYAFSTVGAIEALHKQRTGTLVELSVQQIVDYDVRGTNEGGDGGTPWEAFDYIKRVG
ncbi:Cysteine endopeptidase RepA [Linum perenne]